eukprot:86085-Prymnesium_polylepis.2
MGGTGNDVTQQDHFKVMCSAIPTCSGFQLKNSNSVCRALISGHSSDAEAASVCSTFGGTFSFMGSSATVSTTGIRAATQ